MPTHVDTEKHLVVIQSQQQQYHTHGYTRDTHTRHNNQWSKFFLWIMKKKKNQLDEYEYNTAAVVPIKKKKQGACAQKTCVCLTRGSNPRKLNNIFSFQLPQSNPTCG